MPEPRRPVTRARLTAEQPAGLVADSRLDDLDFAIVECLQVEGRASYKSIANRIGVSETTVRNRVRRLLDEDLIQIVTVLRPIAPGATVVAILQVKVLGDPMTVAETVGAWPEVTWVVLTSGAWDLLVEVVAADRARMTTLWRALHGVQGVVEMQVSTYLRVTKQLYSGPQVE